MSGKENNVKQFQGPQIDEASATAHPHDGPSAEAEAAPVEQTHEDLPRVYLSDRTGSAFR